MNGERSDRSATAGQRRAREGGRYKFNGDNKFSSNCKFNGDVEGCPVR